MRPRFFLLTFVVVLLPRLSWATEIANGSFSSGDFSGWLLSAEDFNLDEVEPRAEVVVIDGGFATKLSTGSIADSLFIQRIEQSFVVDPSRPGMAFDVSGPVVAPDLVGSNTDTGIDELYVSIRTSPVDPIEPIVIDRNGLHVDPLGTAMGLVDLTRPSNPALEYGVIVDLSGYAGKRVILAVDLIQHDDAFQFDELLISNFEMRAVPEPTALGLLLFGIPSLRRLVPSRRD